MASTETIELSPEIRERLDQWGSDSQGEEEIIRELLIQAEQQGKRWATNDYY